MRSNDREEFSEIIDDAFAAFDRVPLPGTKEQFWGVLQKFSRRTLRQAFARWVSDEERAPTPAAIKHLAFEVSREARPNQGDEDFVLAERVYAYTKPYSKRNPKGNPHGITLSKTIASRRQSESVERYEKRIADEVIFAIYPKMRTKDHINTPIWDELAMVFTDQR